MTSVQSSIRAEVSRGEFPAPSGAEAFSAYTIASTKGLIPEMEYTARLTLDYPMTFETIGEGLRLFEGWALCDLANYRMRCQDNLVSCFRFFLQIGPSLFNIWAPCSNGCRRDGSDEISHSAPPKRRPTQSSTQITQFWLREFFQKQLDKSLESFSKPLCNSQRIRGEYLSALQAHVNSSGCVSCTKVHVLNGETFCKELENKLTQALNEVCTSFILPRDESLNTPYLGMLEFELTGVATHPVSRN